MPRRLKKRDGVWYYTGRVPALFADVDPRGWVGGVPAMIALAGSAGGVLCARIAKGY